MDGFYICTHACVSRLHTAVSLTEGSGAFCALHSFPKPGTATTTMATVLHNTGMNHEDPRNWGIARSHHRHCRSTSSTVRFVVAARNQATRQTNKQPRNQATKQTSNQATKQPSNPATQQPSNQATKQPTNPATQQPSNQATYQPSNPATQQPSNQAAKQPSNQATKQPSNQATNEQTKK